MATAIACYYVCGIGYTLVNVAFNIYEGNFIVLEEPVSKVMVTLAVILVFAATAATWPLWWASKIYKDVSGDKSSRKN